MHCSVVPNVIVWAQFTLVRPAPLPRRRLIQSGKNISTLCMCSGMWLALAHGWAFQRRSTYIQFAFISASARKCVSYLMLLSAAQRIWWEHGSQRTCANALGHMDLIKTVCVVLCLLCTLSSSIHMGCVCVLDCFSIFWMHSTRVCAVYNNMSQTTF